MKWTEEQVAKLKELCQEGKSNKKIAAALGCRVEDVFDTIVKIRKREYEAKDAILKELTKALSLANPDIDTLELSVDMEHVQIRYKNGYRRTACIAADSKIAMIVDVVKVAMK